MDITIIDFLIILVVCLAIGALVGIPMGKNTYTFALEKEKNDTIQRLNECMDILKSARVTVPAWKTLNITVYDNVSQP